MAKLIKKNHEGLLAEISLIRRERSRIAYRIYSLKKRYSHPKVINQKLKPLRSKRTSLGNQVKQLKKLLDSSNTDE